MAYTSSSVYVDTAGDTMTGPLVLAADPDVAMKAATKQYVDNKPSGGIKSISIIAGNTTAGASTGTDYIYRCNAVLTLTLPTAIGNTSRYTVKNAIVGDITIATTAGQTIDGAATFVITTQLMSIDLISDGTNWMVI